MLDEPWFIQADMSKYIAYIITACDQNLSLSPLLDPHDKINELIEKYKTAQPQQMTLNIDGDK